MHALLDGIHVFQFIRICMDQLVYNRTDGMDLPMKWKTFTIVPESSELPILWTGSLLILIYVCTLISNRPARPTQCRFVFAFCSNWWRVHTAVLDSDWVWQRSARVRQRLTAPLLYWRTVVHNSQCDAFRNFRGINDVTAAYSVTMRTQKHAKTSQNHWSNASELDTTNLQIV